MGAVAELVVVALVVGVAAFFAGRRAWRRVQSLIGPSAPSTGPRAGPNPSPGSPPAACGTGTCDGCALQDSLGCGVPARSAPPPPEAKAPVCSSCPK